jgi:sporadic carbohydrate cluster protein (TIGR04323 family)
MKKIYAGYISLKPINGVIFPSYIQNQTNKNFITNNLNSTFFLSTNENEYSENRIVLNSLINEKNKISGIVMMSAFSMPENAMLRSKIYKDLFKNKKELHFIFENYLIKKKGDEKKIEEYLIFKNEFFINLKSSLNKFERKHFVSKKGNFI